jgi:hypothetical protein
MNAEMMKIVDMGKNASAAYVMKFLKKSTKIRNSISAQELKISFGSSTRITLTSLTSIISVI